MIRVCALYLALIATTYPGFAIAQTSSEPCPELPNPMLLQGPTPVTICIPLRPDTWRTLVVPKDADFKVKDHPHFDLKAEKQHARLHITALKGAPIGSSVEYKLLSPIFTTTVRLQVAEDGINDDIEIRHETLEQAQIRQLQGEIAQRQREIATLERDVIPVLKVQLASYRKQAKERGIKGVRLRARIKQLMGEITALQTEIPKLQTKLKQNKANAKAEQQKARQEGLQEGRKKAEHQAEARRRADEARQIRQRSKNMKQTRLRPLSDHNTQLKLHEAPIHLQHGSWGNRGELLFVPFSCPPREHDPRPFDVVQVSLRHADKTYPAELYELNRSSNSDAFAKISPGDNFTGVLAIDAKTVTLLAQKAHAIEFHDATGERSYIANLHGWRPQAIEIVIQPLTGREEFEKRVREEEQVIIAPRAVAGVFWVPNGLEAGAGRKLDATSFVGGGVRVTKGVSQLLAFEGEFIVGDTGEASFGDDTRDGLFGRLQAGAALRFGHETAPILRFGIGILTAFYQPTPESGTSSEFSGLMFFGLGYTKRISEKWLVGTSATAILQGTEQVRTLEVGVHIGYGFTPGYNPNES